MTSNSVISTSRRKCDVDTNIELKLNMIDYWNNYFTSDDPEMIRYFYSGFKDRSQLIEWMRKRPKGSARIREVEGRKNVAVVIPTANFDGKNSLTCRKEVFNGIQMVFVESAEIPDYYFNGAHNVNIGIRKALEYKPKWIIVSGDDLFKIDEVTVLENQLLKLSEEKIDMVYTKPSHYHSSIHGLSRKGRAYLPYVFLSERKVWKSIYELERRFDIDFFTFKDRLIASCLISYLNP